MNFRLPFTLLAPLLLAPVLSGAPGDEFLGRWDITVAAGEAGGTLDARESEPGPIMIQGDHGPVQFRRIVLTPLE